MFRYRLWRLRDRLADEIRDRVFDDDAQPKLLLQFVEASIEIAPDVGAIKLLFVRWSSRHIRTREFFDFERLSPDDAARMTTYFNEFRALSVRHVAFGSLSGWILTALLAPLAVLVTLIERVRGGDDDNRSVIREARNRVSDEVDPGFTLLNGRGRSARSMSHMI
jgi:hypothetical protein